MIAAALFAAGEWLSYVVPVVFFIIWVINQMVAGKAKPQGRGVPPRRAPEGERPLRPPAPGGQPAAQRPAAGPTAQLNQEIEQFLKRAGASRNPRPPRREAPMKSPPKAPPKAPPVAVLPRSESSPEERRDFDSVAASVEKHIASRSFERRTEHLADDISQADKQMEQHVQQSFNRRVGTLSDSGGKSGLATDAQTLAAADPSPAAGGEMAALLANPQSFRQAFILGEILRRPESRW